jgi:hypothetical protein
MKNNNRKIFLTSLILLTLIINIGLANINLSNATIEDKSNGIISLETNTNDPWALEMNGSVFSSAFGTDPWTFTGNPPIGYEFVSTAADNNHTYVLTSNGQVWRHQNYTWSSVGWSKLNVVLPNSSTGWVSIDVSNTYLYVLNANGSVYRMAKAGWPNPGSWVIGSNSLHNTPPPSPFTTLQIQPASSFVSVAVDWNDSFCFVLRNNGEIFRHSCDSAGIWGVPGSWTNPTTQWWIYQSYGQPTPYTLEHGDGINPYWNHPSTGWVSIDVYDNYFEINYSVYALHNSGLVARKSNINFMSSADYWMMTSTTWVYDFRWTLPFDDWNNLWQSSTAFVSIACNDNSIFIMQNTGTVYWILESDFNSGVLCPSWAWSSALGQSPLQLTVESKTGAFVSIDAWTEPFIIKNDGKAWRCWNYTYAPPWESCGDNNQNNGKGTLYPDVFSYSSIAAFNNTVLYILQKNGTVYDTTDGGATWSQFVDLGYGNDSAWVSIATANHRNHSYIYALYNNGTVFQVNIINSLIQNYGIPNTGYPPDTSWVSIDLDGNSTIYALRNLGLVSYKFQGGTWKQKGITIGNIVTGFSHPQDSSWVSISSYHVYDGIFVLRNDMIVDIAPPASAIGYINLISSANIDSCFVAISNIPNNFLMLNNIGDVYDQTTNKIGDIPGDSGFVDITYCKDIMPWDNNPPDQVILSSGPYQVSWFLYDDIGLYNYSLYDNNGTYTGTHACIPNNGTQIILNKNAVSAGLYEYTISYNDTFGQTNFDTVWVLIDINNPWSNSPSDIVTDIATGSETINWNIYDDFKPGFYRVFRNNTPSAWQSWTNGSVINHPIYRGALGAYNYTIQYNDSVGKLGSDTVWVMVNEDPQSNQPTTPITIKQGSTEYIDWILTDSSGSGYYRVFIEDTPGTWNPWANDTSVQFQIDTSSTGIFNYTIQYNDSYGSFGLPSTVIVNITNFPPQCNQPTSPLIVEQSSISFIEWVIIDDVGAGNYIVLINDNPQSMMIWINDTSVHFPINTAMTGTYNYTITYNDSYGNFGTPSTVIIHINPVTTSPPIPGFMFYIVLIGIITLFILKRPKRLSMYE